MKQMGNKNYYITDHLRSTRKVVTNTNTVKETINYYPYGGEITMTSPSQLLNNTNVQPFRFSGKELDRSYSQSMYDFGARWYDVAGVPMWTSIDPMAEDNYSVTPYSYCNGDPVNRIDPDGMDWIIAHYEDDLFVFNDSRIKCFDDISKYYGTNSYIQYIGPSGTVSQIQEDEELHLIYELNNDGSFDRCANAIINESHLHIGNDITKNGRVAINSNWHESYLGPNNPQNQSGYFYAVPPIDELDYAAFKHDKEYDARSAVGISGALFNTSVVQADAKLTGFALQTYSATNTWNNEKIWALATGIAFWNISAYKYTMKKIFRR